MADTPDDQSPIVILEGVEVTLQNTEKILQIIKTLYNDDKTIRSFNLWKSLETYLENSKDIEEETDIKNATELIENEKFVLNQITNEGQSVFDLMEELETNNGWELAKDTDGIKTWFKQPKDSNTYCIKMKGIVKSPIFQVLALINEVDLYSTWIPTCNESKPTLTISNFKKMINLCFTPPSPVNWAVSPRELMLYGYGVDMMEDNKLIAMAKSPSKEEIQYLKNQFNYDIPPEGHNQTTRMNCHLAGLLLEPINENETKISILSHTDPKMQLPYWIINLVTKKFAHLIVYFLGKHSANLSDDYKSRIDGGSEIYDKIREKLEQNKNQ